MKRPLEWDMESASITRSEKGQEYKISEQKTAKAGEKYAVCPVCPHHCRLKEGAVGLCRARRCENRQVVPVNYGMVTALALDPIEKKPLHFFHPGSRILSVGSFGCNLHCPFCQNHEIAEGTAKSTGAVRMSPEEILEAAGIPLYGVQNHYSIICRQWEKNGLLQWCKDNNISFWGWAVLEEGLLVDPRIPKKSTMKFAFKRKVRKLTGLYKVMIKVAERHDIKVPQVAMAFCATKGVVPMCGCRKPDQVAELAEAAKVVLTNGEIKRLEEAADRANVNIMGADIFRPFVLKSKVTV